MAETAYVIFAHGSMVEDANEAVRQVARDAASAGGFGLYETAFLDCARPTLSEAIEALAAGGASEIVVLPYFLTLGIHLQRDLPNLVREIENKTPGLSIRVAPPLDGHPALSGILVDRAREISNKL
jgi:sirohydrochlorin ferrochelatase